VLWLKIAQTVVGYAVVANFNAHMSTSLAVDTLPVQGAVAEGQFVQYPGSPFELFQPYLPAGDQPQAIDQLVEGVNDGEVFQTLLGVTSSGKTFTMANVIARLGRPAIVLRPTKPWPHSFTANSASFFRATPSSTSSAITTTTSLKPMCPNVTSLLRRTAPSMSTLSSCG
jgi:hypothetical protein